MTDPHITAELRRLSDAVASLTSELRATKRRGSKRARAVTRKVTSAPPVAAHRATEIDVAAAKRLLRMIG